MIAAMLLGFDDQRSAARPAISRAEARPGDPAADDDDVKVTSSPRLGYELESRAV